MDEFDMTQEERMWPTVEEDSGWSYVDDGWSDIEDDDGIPTDEEISDNAEAEADFLSDAEADAMTLRDAGMGTDEDYGYFGGEDDWLDGSYEE